MVQDRGLEYIGTIRTMAHWDSKKALPVGLNGDGMTSVLSSIHFLSGIAQATDWNRVPNLSVSRLFHKLCKNGSWLALETRRLWFFPLHIYALLGVASNCRHKCHGSGAFLALPLQSMETRACFLAQQQIQKPSLCFSIPIMTLHTLRTLPPSATIDPRPKCCQESHAILWLRRISLTDAWVS